MCVFDVCQMYFITVAELGGGGGEGKAYAITRIHIKEIPSYCCLFKGRISEIFPFS